MGSKDKKSQPDPEWVNNPPLDMNRNLLEQWEERVLQADTEEEFHRRLKWLEKTVYASRDRLSLLMDTRDIISVSTPGEEDTIH